MKLFPISRDGWIFLAILASLTVLAFWIWPLLIILPGCLFLFVLLMFVSTNVEIMISPGDKVRGGLSVGGKVSIA